jgi:hypothetical protein
MIVHFVAIGGIDDHRSLNFLFILNLSFHGVWGITQKYNNSVCFLFQDLPPFY